MPAASKHLRRARAHFQVATKLSGDPDTIGWASVVLFYAARDVAHAVFDADPYLPGVCRHPESHSHQDLANPGTNTVLKRHFSAIVPEYLDLYAVSLAVRYEGQGLTGDDFEGLMDDFVKVCHWARRNLASWDRDVPEWLASVGS